ncbi:vanadium-dependent haloperoxidase [Puia sp. P3]|uniref:vanadium-dependent haloperoxidase n=1 Tax=Puia sp. P3 TaxID=3423952 RepID=UPI003D67F3D2
MKQKIVYAMVLIATASLLNLACRKHSNPDTNGHQQQTRELFFGCRKKWLGVQLPLLYSPAVSYGVNAGRYMAYCGVALYEAVVPGMPSYQSLNGQLNEMPQMPPTEPGKAYHWPTCANAALAEMTRRLFTFTPATTDAVQKLEDSLNGAYATEIGDTAIFQRSKAFGKAVAEKIFTWSTTDHPWSSNPPLVLTNNSPGLWWPENNNPTIASGLAYWGDTRTMVAGSIDNVTSTPYVYNDADVTSPYYKDYREVYDLSKSLTYDQKRLAKYYDDPAVGGYPSGSSYIAVFKQILDQKDPALDMAAYAYARTGMSLFDATIGSMKGKFHFMQERPFQFIRRVIEPSNDPATWWKPYIPTPPYPDFPANHAVFSGAFAQALTIVFGDPVAFINDTYKGKMIDLGKGSEDMGSYSYGSFLEFANAIAISRVYGGIHTRHAVEEGTKQGIKTAKNIDSKVKFRRD